GPPVRKGVGGRRAGGAGRMRAGTDEGLLAEARRAEDAGTWPPGSPPPLFDRMACIETRGRTAARARAALDGDAEIIEGDARTLSMEPASAVLLFDVLHRMRADEQAGLLGNGAARRGPCGV